MQISNSYHDFKGEGIDCGRRWVATGVAHKIDSLASGHKKCLSALYYGIDTSLRMYVY